MTAFKAATTAAIAEGGACLRAGRLVAFPTETVYGLGADARSDVAVAQIYAAKGRPVFNPLIAHVASRDLAEREGRFDATARALADAFWPGPLTLVLPVAPTGSVSLLARSGLDSVALRMPAHPVALALLRAAGCPVAAPSANRSGRISPTEAAHVMADLDGRIDLILDGGACSIGVESTIVSCLDRVEILRPGGLSRRAIEDVVGYRIDARRHVETAPVAPGLLLSHYAPRAAVRLGASDVKAGEAVLDFGGRLVGQGAVTLDLSPGCDPTEAAAHLFAYLRQLDASGAAGIAVAPIPDDGLGEAINDRLRRAAAPRG
ncbi:L-threonylcarbamoyladenylate synthase [Lichenihabitans psoromatis]|uniref:L-threonylcarbamoyladenylate synthase n=1 Tax=Lichenihabitans psoromatis TaxID=2528642 RepID=UPI001035EE41|nr:L-threonylcarbamoyladenylate synthase [Lichenihabitans psoromatis]